MVSPDEAAGFGVLEKVTRERPLCDHAWPISWFRSPPNVYPRPARSAPRMPRPVLRLATRLTRRTRTTAWAIAFACMVLVGTLSLADGLANGVGSVADRIGSGPAAYIRGRELLASEIDANVLSGIPGDFLALRAHSGVL